MFQFFRVLGPGTFPAAPKIHFGQVNAAGRPYAGPLKIESPLSAVVYADVGAGCTALKSEDRQASKIIRLQRSQQNWPLNGLCTFGHTYHFAPVSFPMFQGTRLGVVGSSELVLSCMVPGLKSLVAFWGNTGKS